MEFHHMKGVASRLRSRVGSVIWLAGLTAAACFGAAVACSFSVRGVLGARVQPCDPASPQAPVVLALPELSRAPFNPRFKPEGCVLVSGFWMQDERGEVEMRVVSDGAASLAVDGNLVADHAAQSPQRMASGRVWLDAGAHRFEMKFEPEGFSQLRGVVVDEGGARNLDPTFLRAPLPWEYFAERASRVLVELAAAFVLLGLGALLLSPGSCRPALAILSFAWLLRFEALIGRYGEGLPGAWVRNLFRLGHSLRPDTWSWEKVLDPYMGGDPVNYIKFARQMTGFFDAHVREPLFVAWSRLFIVDLRFGDVGISVASMIGSCALVGATFIFARERFGKGVALFAALLLAADPAEISLSVEGWRDGAFAASFLLALWALDRARLDPSSTKAALAGVVLGASCLLRLSALSYVAPALIDLALFGPAPRRRRLAAAAWALGVTALLVGPYLVSCAIAYGDPFFAVDYHLRHYRPAIAGPNVLGASAASVYVFSVQDPWGRADTLFAGLTSIPFLTKWEPLTLWFGRATTLVSIASVLGLMGWMASSAGRRVLVLTGLALAPFAVSGGAEYRFTLFAYSIYLVAAGWFIAQVVALPQGTVPLGSALGRAVKIGAVFAALCLLGVALRHARTVADGEAARGFTVWGGPRDALSASGFGMPHYGVEGFVRTSVETRRSLTVALQPRRPWQLTLRWNGSEAGQVLEDNRLVGDFPPTEGSGPAERTMPLPASSRTQRRFQIVGGGTFEFLSARFSSDPAGMPTEGPDH